MEVQLTQSWIGNVRSSDVVMRYGYGANVAQMVERMKIRTWPCGTSCNEVVDRRYVLWYLSQRKVEEWRLANKGKVLLLEEKRWKG